MTNQKKLETLGNWRQIVSDITDDIEVKNPLIAKTDNSRNIFIQNGGETVNLTSLFSSVKIHVADYVTNVDTIIFDKIYNGVFDYAKHGHGCIKIKTFRENVDHAMFAIQRAERAILDGSQSTNQARPATTENFIFESGRVLYQGEDLKLPTGFAINVFKKLHEAIDNALDYQKLDEYSSKNEASGQLKTAISRIRGSLKGLKTPYRIITKRGESYLLTHDKRSVTL